MQLSFRHVLSSLVLGTALSTAPALAEMTRSLNMNGATGLIDMPSGDAQDDATFSFSIGNIGPITRTTLSFQASERLSASFRFQTWRDWDTIIPGDERETDRSIDLRYQVRLSVVWMLRSISSTRAPTALASSIAASSSAPGLTPSS